MKKVLVITYYWPPAGGGGVQRWLKFSKYLRNYGWEPIIYTAEGGESAMEDPGLVKEIPEGIEEIRVPIWEPYSLYKKITGKKKDEKVYSGFITENKKASLGQKLSVWIRGNFFIPDARKFWIKPSIKYLTKYLKEHQVDAIISNGPPHSTHMIALGLKRKFNLPWLADFRDPWTNIDFYDQLMLTGLADKKHKRLEKNVLQKADKVVTVSWSWAEDFKNIVDREIEVITNGYDAADFPDKDWPLTSEFMITQVGSMNKDRDVKTLWKVLEEMCNSNSSLNKQLKIKLIGPVDHAILNHIEAAGLSDKLEKINSVPHNEVIEHLCTSQVLLLPLNNTPNIAGVIPGKLYEYLAARRPILCIGSPKGDSARIINETNGGSVADFDDAETIRSIINRYFESFQNGNLKIDSTNIEQYSREKLAGYMTKALDEIIETG